MTTEHDALTLEVVVNADVPLPDSITENSLESMITAALEAESQSGDWEVSLLFTSDDVIQAMHLEAAPMIFLFYPKGGAATTTSVKNFRILPTGNYRLWDTWKEEA